MTTVTTGGGLPANFQKLTASVGFAQGGAPSSSWNALVAALAAGPLGHSGRKVIFNLGGESLPSQGGPKGQGYGVNDVANFCRAGGVWIDYCGWPMYYNPVNPSYQTSGAQGFRTFLSDIGAVGMPFSTFDSYGISSVNLSGGLGTGGTTSGTWPYNRSMVLKQRPPQVSWFIPNLRTSPAGNPFKTYGTGSGATDHWLYPSFALLIGSGAYVYAYGGLPSALFTAANPGIAASTYAAFINGMAAYIGSGGVLPVVTSTGGGTPGGASAPTGLRQVSATTTSITFAWNAVSGASSYQIGHVANGATAALKATTGTSATITGLNASFAETVAVRAQVGGQWSAWSASVTGHTQSAGGGSPSPTPNTYTPATPGTSLTTTEKVAVGGAVVAAVLGGTILLRER